MRIPGEYDKKEMSHRNLFFVCFLFLFYYGQVREQNVGVFCVPHAARAESVLFFIFLEYISNISQGRNAENFSSFFCVLL